MALTVLIGLPTFFPSSVTSTLNLFRDRYLYCPTLGECSPLGFLLYFTSFYGFRILIEITVPSLQPYKWPRTKPRGKSRE